MNIIQQRSRGTGRRVSLDFESLETPGSGYSFDCNEAGTPIFKNESARVNYERVKDDPTYKKVGVNVETWTYAIPTLGKCDCGREVVLEGFTCPCECGRDYNSSGQLLAARSQWGEETGETAADILMGVDLE
jgi:hypothetical protein